MLTRMLALLTVLGMSAITSRAEEDPKTPTADEVKAAQAKLTEYLKGIRGTEAARVTALTGDGIGATFPDHVLFSVIFPQYPVARVALPPLGSSNVIAVPKKDGKPVPITDVKKLEAFFKENARAVKTGDESVHATKAWARAAAELNQDGFYKFTVGDEGAALKGDTITAIGVAKVDPQGGNKGEIKATLTFKGGKLTTAETKVNLIPGPRPICQATKLLDPDPIVRRMAEDAIRVMGSAAKPYLDEQRAKASAELREAIDRIWQRIIEEDR